MVTFPDGRRVRGRGLRHDPIGPDPQFGCYLSGREPDPFPWPHVWIRWPDFRLPADRSAAVAEIAATLARATELRVEFACGGGRGRTGTALAVAAVLTGVPPAEAVVWVRRHYHQRAVETPWQRRWVEGLSGGRSSSSSAR